MIFNCDPRVTVAKRQFTYYKLLRGKTTMLFNLRKATFVFLQRPCRFGYKVKFPAVCQKQVPLRDVQDENDVEIRKLQSQRVSKAGTRRD